jgi:CRP/FNR family transcriptional regulator, cyclic AMP receptor protein
MSKSVDTTEPGDPTETKARPPFSFSSLDADTRAEFIQLCSRMTLPPGESLFFQESQHSHTYVIQSGIIRTFYVSEAGREVTLGFWSNGDVVGGPCILGGGQHVWSAVANRQSEVYVISGANLRKLAESNVKVMNWVIKVLEFKLRWMSILFQIHGTERVQDRLAKLLLLMGDIYGDDVGSSIVIKQDINQTDLATLVGASRQWTNKALAELRAKGVIGMDGRRIILHDPKALRNILGIQNKKDSIKANPQRSSGED